MNVRDIVACGVLLGCAAPLPAAAEICADDAICASDPAGIVTALQKLGYKAMLSKSDSTGNPTISSAAAGYTYDIFFYGCNEHVNCDSISFSVTYSKEAINSATLANEWNQAKRFSAMSYDPKDGTLTITYDVSTVGGLNQKNFADVVSWWETMLGQARTFFDAHPSLAKATSSAAAKPAK